MMNDQKNKQFQGVGNNQNLYKHTIHFNYGIFNPYFLKPHFLCIKLRAERRTNNFNQHKYRDNLDRRFLWSWNAPKFYMKYREKNYISGFYFRICVLYFIKKFILEFVS